MTTFVYLSIVDTWTEIVNTAFMTEAKKEKILAAARSVFLRYGYKRVSMNDIAEAAGVSRPALYVVFKNKEDIFTGVYRQWADATIEEVERDIAAAGTPGEKIQRAFDIWSVRPFEMMMKSPESKELIECAFGFAQSALTRGYKKFEATITPLLAPVTKTRPHKSQLSPQKTAHVLSSAVRGFKQTATTPAELRQLIRDLLVLAFGP